MEQSSACYIYRLAVGANGLLIGIVIMVLTSYPLLGFLCVICDSPLVLSSQLFKGSTSGASPEAMASLARLTIDAVEYLWTLQHGSRLSSRALGLKSESEAVDELTGGRSVIHSSYS